jgi:2-C-methyl-D-erythritol 2,4-cyclodiphosphate synthase
MAMKIRIGFGYDVHRLEEGRIFTLGGIKIEHHKGAVGHSDADVLIHAICDALLGAANLRDIGFHFSDKDPEYKGIDSKILLDRVNLLLRSNGFSICNIDSTISLQKPKISAMIPEMQKSVAVTLGINVDDISIKATTTETLGFEGREEGVSAYAVVLIEKNKD